MKVEDTTEAVRVTGLPYAGADQRVATKRPEFHRQRSSVCQGKKAEIPSLLENQGGYVVELASLDDVSITFSGFGRYGHGRGSCSKLTLINGGKETVTTLRFHGKDTAENLKTLLESRG